MNQKGICRSFATRNGFALLMVVACILLITVVVVSISRQSLLLAMESADAADQLQRKWGRVSLERAGLIAAVNLYGGEPSPLAPPSSSNPSVDNEADRPVWNAGYKIPVVLKGKNYRVVLADESAKANLETLLRLKDAQTVNSVVSTLSNGKLRRIQLQNQVPTAARSPTRTKQERREFDSWGEVLWIGSADHRAHSIVDLPSLTEKLTIWGDGKINLQRASDETLFEVSRLVISDGQSRDWIDEYRDSSPQRSLEMVLRELRADSRQQRVLLGLFSNRTTCVSVWVLGDQAAAGHSLCVATRSSTNLWETETTRYTW